MALIRSLFVGSLLVLGVANAAPTAPSDVAPAQSKFDVVSWLNKAVFNEERELVVKQALHLWLLNNPDAAKEADSELAEFLKSQEDLRQAIKNEKSMNLTELLEKNIEMTQLDLSANRVFLSDLNAKELASTTKSDIIDKEARARSARPKSTLKDDKDNDDDDPRSSKKMLEELIEDEEEALETRQRAEKYLLAHPEMAAEAERVRAQVIARLEAEGEVSSKFGDHAKEVGLVTALNHSVIAREKMIKALKIALEILRTDPEFAQETAYQVQQMIMNPALAVKIANDADFDTLQSGDQLHGSTESVRYRIQTML